LAGGFWAEEAAEGAPAPPAPEAAGLGAPAGGPAAAGGLAYGGFAGDALAALLAAGPVPAAALYCCAPLTGWLTLRLPPYFSTSFFMNSGFMMPTLVAASFEIG